MGASLSPVIAYILAEYFDPVALKKTTVKPKRLRPRI